MSVFRFRNDSPVIPRPLHNSATGRLTTLPIELINDQRDMSVAGYKNAKYHPLRGNKGKRHTTSLRLCNIKLDCTYRLMGIDTARGHADLLCIVPKTLTETSREKGDKNTEMLRATCSADFHRCRPDSNDTKDARVSAGSRRKTYRDLEKTCVLVKTANHVQRSMHASRENNVQQRRRKTRST